MQQQDRLSRDSMHLTAGRMKLKAEVLSKDWWPLKEGEVIPLLEEGRDIAGSFRNQLRKSLQR